MFTLMLFAVDASILPSHTAFVAVVNTGDFESADADVIWGVYRKLAERSAFAPPAISISLDSETRSLALKNELITKSEGLVRFLPRRTYENYLLHPGAIAAAIGAESAEQSITEEVISKWIDDHCGDTKYFSRVKKPTSSKSDEWRIVIDAPKFLGDMIAELTDQRQDYRSRKVQYGVGLTRWLIENEPNYLQEITEYVKGLLSATTASSANGAG